eukprot:TRINITY_DN3958_c0_g1_i5.p1 TRINITY_DN3958_c0_g1~~TRINITY_DN3958_c0_g1_i5.p1  ORF type:complete len:378 (+),score=87.44 TRINITY_DN3958_c0_g1_i5:52-1134(+)
MATNVILRNGAQMSSLSKILRLNYMSVAKFSSDSNEGGKGLGDLLKSFKTSEDGRPQKPAGKMRKGLRKEKDMEEKNIDPDLLSAAKDVAKASKSPSNTESDLMVKLKEMLHNAKDAKNENTVTGEKPSLSGLFGDMKIEKPAATAPTKPMAGSPTSRSVPQAKQKNLSLEQLAFLEKRAQLRRQKSGEGLEDSYTPVDLFGAEPLGIFTKTSPEVPVADESKFPVLRTWKRCAERELVIMSTPPPRNALEEQIQLTQDGKLWKFPIDNEQDLDYSHEKFHQHVFLEKHLEPWCPKVGPVKHFMELVCIGLSKNPYVSVQYKIDTIAWFKNYFESEAINEILVHKGAWPDPTQQEEAQKQ